MSVFDKYKDGGASIFNKYKKEPRSLSEEAGAWLTGEDKESNIPVLGQDFSLGQIATSNANKAKLAALVASTPDDKKLSAGFQRLIPDSQVDTDKFGNVVVAAPVARDEQGKPLTYLRFYPNPKGLADIPTAYQAAGQVSLASPFAKVIGGTGYRAAASTGAAEAGFLEAITSVLTDTAYRLSEPAGGGAAGIAFKGAFDVIKGTVGKIANVLKMGNRPNAAKMAEIKTVLADNGFDPDLIMDQAFKKIMSDVGGGVDPVASARLRTAESLPTPVPMTRGDVTDDKSRQLLEDQMRSGGFGQDVAQSMERTRQGQQEAIGTNLQQIQEGMAQGGTVVEPRAGARMAQETLVEQRGAAKSAYDEAYKKARESQAYLDPDAGDQMAADIFNSVSREFSEAGAPQAYAIWRNEVEPLLREGQSLNDIFAARSKLSAHAANLGTEGGTAGRMAKELDARLTQMADDVMLHGDPNSVRNWLNAISQFKDFKQTWDTNGILKKLTTKGMRDGDVVLNVAPEEAANAIFGAALNPNRTNLARDLIKMRQNLPEDVWNGLRQEFFMKLSNQMLSPQGDIKGAAFAKSWSEIKKNKTLLNTLFTDAEQKQIDALSTTALRISGSAKNYSNTANSVFALMGRFAQSLGGRPTGQMLLNMPVMETVKSAYGKGQLVVPPLKSDSQSSVVFGGAAGSATGGTMQEDLNRRLFGE